MKNRGLLLTALILSITAAVLSSCRNIVEFNEKKNSVQVTIDICNLRSAAPQLSAEKISFTVTAECEGKENVSVTEPDEDDVYSLALSEGTWTLTAEGKKDSKTILKGTTVIKVSENPRYSANIPVYFVTDEGSGYVNLTIDVSEVEADRLVVNNSSGKDDLNGTYQAENGKINLSKDNVTPGVYELQLSFYKLLDEKDVLLWTTEETVNVKSNVSTESWIKAGGTPYLFEENGSVEFRLTKKLIYLQTENEFYVAPENETGMPFVSGTENNCFTSIEQALNRIIILNNLFSGMSSSSGTSYRPKSFTVLVDGTSGTKNNTVNVINEAENNLSINIKCIAENVAEENIPVIKENISFGENVNVIIDNVAFENDIKYNGGKLTLKNYSSAGNIVLGKTNLTFTVVDLKKSHAANIKYALTEDDYTEFESTDKDDSTRYHYGSKVIVKENEDGTQADFTAEDAARFTLDSKLFVTGIYKENESEKTVGVMKYDDFEVYVLPVYETEYEVTAELNGKNIVDEENTFANLITIKVPHTSENTVLFTAVPQLKNDGRPVDFEEAKCEEYSVTLIDRSENILASSENKNKQIEFTECVVGTYKLNISMKYLGMPYSTEYIINVVHE